MVYIASGVASIVSAPSPPWVWMSISPGMTVKSRAFRVGASSSAGALEIEAILPFSMMRE